MKTQVCRPVFNILMLEKNRRERKYAKCANTEIEVPQTHPQVVCSHTCLQKPQIGQKGGDLAFGQFLGQGS